MVAEPAGKCSIKELRKWKGLKCWLASSNDRKNEWMKERNVSFASFNMELLSWAQSTKLSVNKGLSFLIFIYVWIKKKVEVKCFIGSAHHDTKIRYKFLICSLLFFRLLQIAHLACMTPHYFIRNHPLIFPFPVCMFPIHFNPYFFCFHLSCPSPGAGIRTSLVMPELEWQWIMH